jgi:D-3-phosphoglycerate dehydrogenase / 2-oxoglutarate reductase
MPPPSSRKIVVRFNLWSDPAMEERFAREPDIELRTCDLHGPEGDAWSELAPAHVYQISAARDELPRRWFATAELLERCPRLLCVSSAGAGYDTVDATACTKAGVLVVNQSGGNARSVAEHTIGLMLDVSRRISEGDRLLRREWRGFTREDVMGREMSGKTVGLVGIGYIGRIVARLAGAFDMRVLAFDPYLTEEEITRRGAESVTLDTLLEQSDFVSLHCPRDQSTLGMMDARAFARMKEGAVFVTTARGGIHDEGALLDALRSGHLRGAGIDVWDKEPPPPDHPLLRQENVVASYHTAGVTPEARRNMWALAAEQIVGILKGGRPPRLVNPEVWPAYAERFEAITGSRVQRESLSLE